MKSTTPHHNKKDVQSIIDKLSSVNVKGSYFLLVLAGRYNKGKKQLLKEIAGKTGELSTVDMRDIISTNEEETYQKIDKLFKSMSKDDKCVYLENCDVLSGEYTGFTYSSVRYATPQEKYLMNTIKSSEKVIIMDILDQANVHNTLKRLAQGIVTFDGPSGMVSKLIWNIQNIRIQGHTFENRRPLNVR